MTDPTSGIELKRAADRQRQRKHRHKALGSILEVVPCDAENVTPRTWVRQVGSGPCSTSRRGN
jgi:hypothetical protein